MIGVIIVMALGHTDPTAIITQDLSTTGIITMMGGLIVMGLIAVLIITVILDIMTSI